MAEVVAAVARLLLPGVEDCGSVENVVDVEIVVKTVVSRVFNDLRDFSESPSEKLMITYGRRTRCRDCD